MKVTTNYDSEWVDCNDEGYVSIPGGYSYMGYDTTSVKCPLDYDGEVNKHGRETNFIENNPGILVKDTDY